LEGTQSGSRIKLKSVDEKGFTQLVVTRYYHLAEALGSVDIKNISRQSGKSDTQNIVFEGDTQKVLEFIYKLRESHPESRPVKIQYRRSPKGASISASFETKGHEWPVEPFVPTVPLTLKKLMASVEEVFRDPSVLRQETPTQKGPFQPSKKWELIGLTKSDSKTEAMVQQVAGSSSDENLEFRILKQGDRLFDWKLDLAPFEMGLTNNGQSFILLKRGKEELKWGTGGEIFDGKTITPPKK
jgi:hypothetical protein